MTVAEIARAKGVDQIEQREMWHGYRVYSLYKKKLRGAAIGLPCFVLEKDSEVREATDIEIHQILFDRRK